MSPLEKIKGKLIVSCQAEGNSPFNNPEALALFAIAAQQGGSGGIRSEGINNILKIKQVTELPIIGIIKSVFEDGSVCITRQYNQVVDLINIGVDIVAVDGTQRKVNDLSGPEFIRSCKAKYPAIPIIADIATLKEAIDCVNNGADAISTTLRGYTPETYPESSKPFDVPFLLSLISALPKNYPVIAEGKIKNTDTVNQIKNLAFGQWL